MGIGMEVEKRGWNYWYLLPRNFPFYCSVPTTRGWGLFMRNSQMIAFPFVLFATRIKLLSNSIIIISKQWLPIVVVTPFSPCLTHKYCFLLLLLEDARLLHFWSLLTILIMPQVMRILKLPQFFLLFRGSYFSGTPQHTTTFFKEEEIDRLKNGAVFVLG